MGQNLEKIIHDMAVTLDQVQEMTETIKELAEGLWWQAWAVQCIVCPDHAADKIDFAPCEDRATLGSDPSARGD